MLHTADNDVITDAYAQIIDIVGDNIGLNGIIEILNKVYDVAHQAGYEYGYEIGTQNATERLW